jgi:hypothetical protein
VDPLRRDDLERAGATSVAQRLAQALQATQDGIKLKRAALRARFPDASEGDVDRMIAEWLLQDPRA